jgi:hypothetical protein
MPGGEAMTLCAFITGALSLALSVVSWMTQGGQAHDLAVAAVIAGLAAVAFGFIAMRRAW